MAVTLKQIAVRSGVSAQTVSRIVRGKDEHHRPETRERVLQVARELGYRPNPLSRALLGGKSMTVGLIVHGIGGRLSIASVRGLTLDARDKGYLTYIVPLADSGDSDAFREAAEDLLDRRVDGLLVQRGMPVPVSARRWLAEQTVPTVFLDWGPPKARHRVVFDREAAFEQVAAHLADLGHRRVALAPSVNAADFPELKILPCERACTRHGIEMIGAGGEWAVETGLDAESSGRETAARFLGDETGATALLMNNDEAAVGALAAIRAAGLSVPDDLSVVGFDDLGCAKVTDPPLTTVHGPQHRAHGIAFEMLHELMTDPEADPDPVVLPFELVVRDSTGPAPAS